MWLASGLRIDINLSKVCFIGLKLSLTLSIVTLVTQYYIVDIFSDDCFKAIIFSEVVRTIFAPKEHEKLWLSKLVESWPTATSDQFTVPWWCLHLFTKTKPDVYQNITHTKTWHRWIMSCMQTKVFEFLKVVAESKNINLEKNKISKIH